MGTDRGKILEEFLEVVSRSDVARLEEYLAPDYVEVYPQSGERVVGVANLRAIIEHYPGGLAPGYLDADHARIIGAEEEYVLGPSLSVVHVAGSGDTWTVVALGRWPDGSLWHTVAVAEFRGDRIRRITEYFAPELPAPEWRSEWVQRLESDEH